jgi:hypothetical protein
MVIRPKLSTLSWQKSKDNRAREVFEKPLVCSFYVPDLELNALIITELMIRAQHSKKTKFVPPPAAPKGSRARIVKFLR